MDCQGLFAGQRQGQNSLYHAFLHCSPPAAAARSYALPRTTEACKPLRAPCCSKAGNINSRLAAAKDVSSTLQLQAHQAITTSTV